MTGPTLPGFAAHELRLAWRDWLAMLTGGSARGGTPGQRRRRLVYAGLGLAAFIAFLHVVADAVVGTHAALAPDRPTLIAITGTGLLAVMLMLSQAMETTTRAFYARADLDLLLSSPAPSARIFAVRIGAIAVSSVLMAALIAGPFINMLAVHGGARWLAAYGVLAAMGAAAASLAVALSVGLFRLIGPRRTRLVAQIVAAIVGAAFVIGIQAVSILAYGRMSRTDILASETVQAWAPTLDSGLYWPARAAMGDGLALAGVLAAGGVVLVLAMTLFAPRFGSHAIAAASAGPSTGRSRERAVDPARSPAAALRAKEWALLRRDPWLLSQTLMQMLYLLPPALLLWRNFGNDVDGLVVIVPVLVMAAGQLAGGLAWLALSAEDAPDLVASAPISRGAILAAKVEAVLGAVLLLVGPLALALTLASPRLGLVTFGGLLAAASAATLVQMMFRAQARRSQFRRRQTSSRLATFTEAFASIGLAGATALTAVGSPLALVPATLVLLLLGLVRMVAPRDHQEPAP